MTRKNGVAVLRLIVGFCLMDPSQSAMTQANPGPVLGWSLSFNHEALSPVLVTYPRHRMGVESPLFADFILAVEPNSWCGRLYGHLIKGNVHLQQIQDDPQYQRDIRRFRRYYGLFLFGPYHMSAKKAADTAFQTLMSRPPLEIAETIAKTVGPKFESGLWMRDVERGIRQRPRPIDPKEIFSFVQPIIDQVIEAALARHPSIYLRGQSASINNEQAKQDLRREMRSWTGRSLQDYVFNRLLDIQPRASLRKQRKITRLDIFTAHQATNNQVLRSGIISLETANPGHSDYYLPAPRFNRPYTEREKSLLKMTEPDLSYERALTGLLRRHEAQISSLSVEDLKAGLRTLLMPTPAQERILLDREGLEDVLANKCMFLMLDTIAFSRAKLERRDPQTEAHFESAARIWLFVARLSTLIPPPGRQRGDVWRWIQPTPIQDINDPSVVSPGRRLSRAS